MKNRTQSEELLTTMTPPTGTKEDGAWSEYARLVLTQLEANTKSLEETRENVHKLRGEVNNQLGTLQLGIERKQTEQNQDIDKRLSELKTEILGAIAKQNTEIALLQLKSGMWGAGAGIIGVLLIWASSHFIK